MSKLLVYPVVLHPEDTGYTVEVPDITGGFTQGEDLTNALEMASDMIGLMLEDTTNYPKPSKLESIHVADNDINPQNSNCTRISGKNGQREKFKFFCCTN